MRRDREYWSRLRKDGRSNWSAGLAAVSALIATIAVLLLAFPDMPTRNKLNPLYWLVLLPLG